MAALQVKETYAFFLVAVGYEFEHKRYGCCRNHDSLKEKAEELANEYVD